MELIIYFDFVYYYHKDRPFKCIYASWLYNVTMPDLSQKREEIAVFGGGCFWCTEAVFQKLNGVRSIEPGYAGGAVPNPTYEQVASGTTGHTESVRIVFDPAAVSYRDLLTVFFATHDPTTPNRQGSDVGTQYRSAIFFTSEEQNLAAQAYIRKLAADTGLRGSIVTEVRPLDFFYPAEDYHRNYFENHRGQPYCEIVIEPKLEKLHDQFAHLIANQSSKKKTPRE